MLNGPFCEEAVAAVKAAVKGGRREKMKTFV